MRRRRSASSRFSLPIGLRKASPACSQCELAASSCTARTTARKSNPTTSPSRSKRRSPSAPATTAPRAAACWRSTNLAKRRRAARVLDLGTGSGVLAIAAAKRLRTRVTASDIDRVAVEAARGNARLNHAGGTITFVRATGANARAIAARRALRPDLRQYPARPAHTAGGAAQPARRAACTYRALRPVAGACQCSAGDLSRAGLVLERRIPLDGWVTLVLRRG